MQIFISENFKPSILRIAFNKLGLKGKYSYEQFAKGMKVELEHGSKLGNKTNVTHNDPIKTAKIVLAHLKEDGQYYDKLLNAGL